MTHATLNITDNRGGSIKARCYWLHEPFAVTHAPGDFGVSVTHIPTGYAIFCDFDSRPHAIRFARLLRRSFRWETVTREGWDSLSSEERQAIGVAIFAAFYATSKAGRADTPTRTEGSR